MSRPGVRDLLSPELRVRAVVGCAQQTKTVRRTALLTAVPYCLYCTLDGRYTWALAEF